MAYVYIRGPVWRHQFSCIVLSGPPADGTILHVVFYPDPRLTAHSHKIFLAGSPADGSQRVNTWMYALTGSPRNYRSRHCLNFVFQIIAHGLKIFFESHLRFVDSVAQHLSQFVSCGEADDPGGHLLPNGMTLLGGRAPMVWPEAKLAPEVTLTNPHSGMRKHMSAFLSKLGSPKATRYTSPSHFYVPLEREQSSVFGACPSETSSHINTNTMQSVVNAPLIELKGSGKGKI